MLFRDFSPYVVVYGYTYIWPMYRILLLPVFSIMITNVADGLNGMGVVGELYYGVGYDTWAG